MHVLEKINIKVISLDYSRNYNSGKSASAAIEVKGLFIDILRWHNAKSQSKLVLRV